MKNRYVLNESIDEEPVRHRSLADDTAIHFTSTPEFSLSRSHSRFKQDER